jgi:hypothetical protein
MSEVNDADNLEVLKSKAISQPLVSHIFTADPSAHVFDGKIYIYPSHDIDAGLPEDDWGGHFGMEDYHVLSMDTPTSEVVDHGVALHVKDVLWATRPLKTALIFYIFRQRIKMGFLESEWQPVKARQALLRRSQKR